MKPSVSIEKACNVLGNTTQAYYPKRKRAIAKEVKEMIIIQHVKEYRKYESTHRDGHIGAKKLLKELKPIFEHEGIKIGRDSFLNLLRKNDMLLPVKRRRGCKTTNSNHSYRKYPNLLPGFTPSKPEEVVVTDITYINVADGHAFLSLVTDLYSHKILGYHLHSTLETKGPLKAMKMANRHRLYRDHHMIHHSDRGVQYCSNQYVHYLTKLGIQISMTENGCPGENAVAERVNGILKHEFLLDRHFATFGEAKRVITKNIKAYNKMRPHNSCSGLTPDEAHKTTEKLEILWKK